MLFKLSKSSFLLLLLLAALFFQFYNFPVLGTHMKLYMPISVFLFVLLGFKVSLKYCYSYETIWLFTYFLLGVSVIWADNTRLGIQLVLGELILLLFYFVFRTLLIRNLKYNLDDILSYAFRFFLIISIILYVLGMLSIYLFHNDANVGYYLNETSMRVYGCYKENVIPRFMGIAESPNNYAYFADFIFWYFILNNKWKFALTTFLTLILTLSTTLYIAILFQSLIYFFYKKKISFKAILSFLILLVIFETYKNIPEVATIIENRSVRNTTGSGRFELWELTWNLISEGPLLGYGINQSRTLYTERYYRSSHNNLLEMGISLGFIGIAIYILFIISFLVITYKSSHRTRNPFFFQMSLGYVIFGLTNNTLHIEYTPFIIAMLSVFMSSLSNKRYKL